MIIRQDKLQFVSEKPSVVSFRQTVGPAYTSDRTLDSRKGAEEFVWGVDPIHTQQDACSASGCTYSVPVITITFR